MTHKDLLDLPGAEMLHFQEALVIFWSHFLIVTIKTLCGKCRRSRKEASPPHLGYEALGEGTSMV